MIGHLDRIEAVRLIDEAVSAGARRAPACERLGICERTYRRWKTEGGKVKSDQRPEAVKPQPCNKFSKQEWEAILAACHDKAFAELPPSQIVPALADQGYYLGSVSSFYRALHEANEQHHRGRSKAPRPHNEPTSHLATGPCQVWSWDVTYLKSPVRGDFYYLYMILDIYSRKIVGWEVHDRETGEYASTLMRKAVLSEGCESKNLVLHADNGSIQKGSTLRATLQWLEIAPSFSRPRVSNDNAFSESAFRTFKYRPDFPTNGFASIEAARTWVAEFVKWYNTVHKHSGINFVTPIQKHTGEEKQILEQRDNVFKQAKARNPNRWSGETRNWSASGAVWLNPEKSAEEKLLDCA